MVTPPGCTECWFRKQHCSAAEARLLLDENVLPHFLHVYTLSAKVHCCAANATVNAEWDALRGRTSECVDTSQLHNVVEVGTRMAA